MTAVHEPEAAFETLSEGSGRRDFLRAATAIVAKTKGVHARIAKAHFVDR